MVNDSKIPPFEMKAQVAEMSKIVGDTLFNISTNTESRIDREFRNDIDNFIDISSRVYAILNKIVNFTDQEMVPDKHFDSQMLIWQGLNTLMSALQLSRQGYTLEPQYLIRPAVENLALALSFFTEGTYYEKFNKLQHSGEKAITPAKKLVKQIGGIYGILSQVTHPSKRTLGYFYMEGEGDKLGSLMIAGGVTDKTMNRVKLNLAILNFITTIYWSSTELLFFEYLEDHTFWIKSDDNLRWSPNTEEKVRYARSLDMFKQALTSA